MADDTSKQNELSTSSDIKTASDNDNESTVVAAAVGRCPYCQMDKSSCSPSGPDRDGAGTSATANDSNKSGSPTLKDAYTLADQHQSRARKKEHNGTSHGKLPTQTITRVDLGTFYPEGGWGWVVCCAAGLVYVLCHGFHFAYGALYLRIVQKFESQGKDTVWLGSLGLSVTLLLSPIITTVCRRKSPRLYAVVGGLVSALGCLFLAFSTQVEQLFISHGVVFSIGSGITLYTANIMIGRYFKRRRELAELFLVSGTGLGTAIMSSLFNNLCSSLGWMHGLQCVAGLLVLTILAGALYRSASVYHPRRKVILHIKSQKKSRRDRNADKPPYFDFSALHMRAVQALMIITAVTALGIHVPVILLMHSAWRHRVPSSSLVLLNVYLGLGFSLGVLIFGYIIIRQDTKCFISRRYLCQSAVLSCGLLCLLATMAKDHNAFSLFAWVFGICCGGYYYSLKMYTFELVKARVMERAWGFINAAQCLPILVGTPIAVYLNGAQENMSTRPSFIFAGSTLVLGSVLYFFMTLAEQHPSNAEVIQKQDYQTSQAMAEAAALLDMNYTDGAFTTKPLNNAQYTLTPVITGTTKRDTTFTSGQPQHGGNGQASGARDKQKQVVLTKISEEHEAVQCDIREVPHLSSINKVTDYLMSEHENLSISTSGDHSHSTSSSGPEKSTSGRHEKKEKIVKVELFDPPSQEKESTATVSYDSDLYINLCEAQV